MKEISISEFKAKCSAILKQVEMTKQPVRITHHGRPIAEVGPVKVDNPAWHDRSWIGSQAGLKILGDIISPACDESDWEVLRED